MKFIHLVGLLVSVSLFVVADLTVASNSSPVEASPKLDVEPPKQTIHALSTAHGRNEERFLMAFFDWLMSVFRSGKVRELEGKLQDVYKVEKAADIVNLMEHAPPPNDHAALNVKVARTFIESDEFVAVYRQLQKHNKETADTHIYSFLRTNLGEDVVAQMIGMVKVHGSRKGKEMAGGLEKAQFRAWLKDGTYPKDVVENLFHMSLVEFKALDGKEWRKKVIIDYFVVLTHDVVGHNMPAQQGHHGHHGHHHHH